MTLLRGGYHVIACCFLSEGEGANRLRMEAQSISESAAKRLHIETLDVTKEESVCELLQRVKLYLDEHLDQRLFALINNAGVARIGLVEWGKFSNQFEQLFAVNLFGVVRMTRIFLPLLRSSNSSGKEFRIININSILSRIPMQPIISYCASKHSSVAFTEGLRRELSHFNCKVVSIEPNFFRTHLCELEGNLNDLKNTWDSTEPDVKTGSCLFINLHD